MKVAREIEVNAPPRDLYEVVMDARRLEDWVTIHQHLEGSPPSQLEIGSTLTQCLKLAGQKFKVHWTVVENDPCKRVVWQGRGPVRSRATVIYAFEQNGRGTRFSYVNEYKLPGGPLGSMAGPMVRRVTTGEVDRSLERLKQLVE